MKLAILNTSLATSDGMYVLRTITMEEAIALVQLNHHTDGIDSAVGQPSIALALTTILGVEIPVNRQLFAQQPGQLALIFKLNGRPVYDRELSWAELEEIGFNFKLLTRIA